MKTINSRLFLVAIASLSLIFACSKQPELIETNSEIESGIANSQFARQLSNSDITDFLDNYYPNKTYSFGASEFAYEGNDSFEVTEVILANESLPRGYVVSDSLTEGFLFFADFDRVAKKVDAYDIKNNQNELLNVNQANGNGDTVLEIDIINHIKNDPTGSASNSKFWGSQESNCATEYVGNGCYQEFCDYTYFVFWIPVEHLTHIPNGQMDCN